MSANIADAGKIMAALGGTMLVAGIGLNEPVVATLGAILFGVGIWVVLFRTPKPPRPPIRFSKNDPGG